MYAIFGILGFSHGSVVDAVELLPLLDAFGFLLNDVLDMM